MNRFPALASCLVLLISTSPSTAGPPSDRLDEILNRSLANKGIEPNPPASDEIFLRRIYLDAAGRIPTKAEVDRFRNDPGAGKRAALIDELLASEGYVIHFYNFWADILRLHSNVNSGAENYRPYSAFVKDALRENLPYDRFVRELITATGDPSENGAAGYYARDRGMPLDNLANTVRIFLGTRLECAQCHNHPFDKWTQMDFYHMAAFSYGVSANGNPKTALNEATQMVSKSDQWDREEKRDLSRALQEIGRPLNRGRVVEYNGKLPQLPHDYQYSDAKPKETIHPGTIFGENPEVQSDADRLQAYAAWMTSPENPRFTTVIANRLWREAMGVGLIEPVDEITDQTVASDPALLDYLEEQLIASGYDMKAFLRMVFNSKAYQREATTENLALGEPYHFQGPVMRRMSAEQIWDSVVALVNPAIDETDWKREQEHELRAASRALFMEAVGDTAPDSLVRNAQRVAQMQRDQRAELDRLQKESIEARKAKDQAKIRDLSQRTNALQNKMREEVYKLVYDPALDGSRDKLVPVSYPGSSGEVGMPVFEMVNREGRVTPALQKMQKEIEQKLLDEEIAALGITDDKARKSYEGYRRDLGGKYLRAANLSSPAPRGHFLREFGQSDRETIENAEDAASVPQALSLLNGPTFGMLANPYSVYRRGIDPIESPADKLDAIYLSLLARRAAPGEQDLLLMELEKRGEEFYLDATFAILNSPEFLFIR